MSMVIDGLRGVSHVPFTSFDPQRFPGGLPSGGGGTTIDIGPGGLSGCTNIGGVRVCGDIPFGGSGGAPSPTTPPAGPMPTTPLDAPTGGPGSGPCPEGRILVRGQCVKPSAAFPGGEPFTIPAANGNGSGVPKVMGTCVKTPILWANRYSQPRGYRLNKSGYYRQDPEQGGAVVYVPPRSAYRRTRRRNSTNPRALSRALSRVEGFRKAADKVKGLRMPTKSCGCK